VLFPQLLGKCQGKTRKDGGTVRILPNFCVVLCIVCFVSFSVLFVCICVLYYCHRVATQLQLNISYHISIIRFSLGFVGPCIFTHLTFKNRASSICRTGVPLPSRCCILYIYFSTNKSTEYFRHAAHSPFFSSKCRLFHNATFFGSCIIHILHVGCAKI
jgi:hypothetical protein